jgi:hypothetical protein
MVAALLLPLLASCGTSAGASAESQVVSPASTATPVVSPSRTPTPTQSPETLTFDLNPIGTSTAHGTVTIVVGGGGYTLTVQAAGLTPNSHHPINFHAGSCASIDVSVEVAVTDDAQANSSGDLTFTATYHNAYGVPSDGRVLTVHGDFPKDARFHIACADLTN